MQIEPLNSYDPKLFTPPQSEAAEGKTISFYYQSSLQSFSPPPQINTKDDAVAAVENKEIERSWLGKAKDWLWNLLQWRTEKLPASDNQDIDMLDRDSGIPKLDDPDSQTLCSQQKITEAGRELTYRLKEIAEFEEEMRCSSSTNLDKLIFLELVYSTLFQKKIKEDFSTTGQEVLLDLHRRNKDLQEKYYQLRDEVIRHAKVNKVLHWIGIGSTAGVVGITAVSYAIGGPVTLLVGGVGTALMSLGKGLTTLSEGILKYKSDKQTGNMHVINDETKANSRGINDELTELQAADDELGELLKRVRRLLDEQSQAEHASLGGRTHDQY